MPLPCSPIVPIKGAQGLQRGAFPIFCFWKVLSQEGQMMEELLDAAGASETRRPRESSLPGTQPVPKAEGLSGEVCLWLPPSLPKRLQAKASMRPSPAFISLFLFLREAKESGGEQPQH